MTVLTLSILILFLQIGYDKLRLYVFFDVSTDKNHLNT